MSAESITSRTGAGRVLGYMGLFAADLRRMAPWIALWVGLVGAQLLVIWGRFSPGLREAFEPWEAYALLFWLFLLVLIPLLVQRDRPFGTRSFWMTRPVGRVGILSEKALFLFFFILLPMLAAQVLAMGIVGLSSKLMPAALWDAAISELVILGFFWLLASLTKNLRQFLFLFFAVFLVLIGLSILSQPGFMTHDSLLLVLFYAFFLGGEWSFGPELALVIFGILSLIYLQRRRRPAAILLAAGLAVMIWWPWDGDMGEGPEPLEMGLEQVQVSLFRDPSGEMSFSGRRGLVAKTRLPVTMAVEDLPEGAAVSSAFAELSFSPLDTSGRKQRGMDWDPVEIEGNRDQVARRLVFQRGATGEGPGAYVAEPVDHQGFVSREMCDAERVAAQGQVRLELVSLDALGALPLEGGASIRPAAWGVSVNSLEVEADRVHLAVEGYWLVFGEIRGGSDLWERKLFLLMEKEGDRVRELSSGSQGNTVRRLITVRPRLVQSSFEVGLGVDLGDPSGWLLAVLSSRRASSQQLTVELEPFSFEGCQGFLAPPGREDHGS